MAEITDVRSKRRPRTQELWLDEQNLNGSPADGPAKDELESAELKKLKRQLQSWYFEEREKQAVNRYQMAIDHDFYDSIQWSQEDAEVVESRGQAAIVYNEVAPMVDWIIGTERRTRVDWAVLPRSPNDVAAADTKTKVLKYVSDINKVPFKRSRAFDDAVKVGVGWLEDGARNDPKKDVLYSGYEDWRRILYDSAATDLDEDGRYLFRWRWVDLDVAFAMFPNRKHQLRKAAVNHQLYGNDDDDFYYLGQHFQASDRNGQVMTRRTYTGDPFMVGTRRQRVKIIESWYRVPTRCQVCIGDEPFNGKVYDERNPAMQQAYAENSVSLVEAVAMRMKCVFMSEQDLLSKPYLGYRHQRFPFTPIWAFRRGRDGMCYGPIRRVRDVQEDLNKRMSKAQFVLSTNQLWGEAGAVDDWDEAREEADRPDGVVIRNKGKELEVKRDTEMAEGQLKLAEMGARKIQNTAGVNNENLGRQTNAVSGEAIKARQLQGSVQTTTLFDNLRYAVQCQGEKQLALVEQFYTEPKVIRLTEAKGRIDWVRINQPEVQEDGSVRMLNDISASQADFVVSEQDFHGTLRQAMFESMMGLAAKMPPEMAVRLLRMAFEYSDMPNKDEIVSEIRRLTGDPDPAKKMTPEELEAMERQRAAQEAMFAQQQAQALAIIAEQQAKARKINAEAEKIIAEVQVMRAGGEADIAGKIEDAVRQVQIEGATQVERVTKQMVLLQGQLAQAQVELQNRQYEIKKEADTKIEVARIEADAKKHVAEVAKVADDGMAPLLKRMEDLGSEVKELNKKVAEESKAREKAEQDTASALDKADKERKRDVADAAKEREQRAKAERDKSQQPPAAPAPAIGELHVHMPAPGDKTITLRGADGKEIKGTVTTGGKKEVK